MPTAQTPSAATLLGGKSVLSALPRGVMDWIPLVRQGLGVAELGNGAQPLGQRIGCAGIVISIHASPNLC